MKPSVVSTLIGPSFNSNQNPEMPVTAVDIQNVVASKGSKLESTNKPKADMKKANAVPAKVEAKAKPVKPEAKPVKQEVKPEVKPEVKAEATPKSALNKAEREKWLQNHLSKQEADIDAIMEAVVKVDGEWSKISVLQYLKKPGFVKNIKNKVNFYGYKP